MMRDLLAPRQASILEQIGWAKSLLVFDYDGTLAPIVADPSKAEMRRTTRLLLAEVAARYPCAVVSGRATEDTRLGLQGVALRAVVGNHGLEPWDNPEPFARAVARWVPVLSERLSAQRGIAIEDKRFSLAIHYRAAPSKRAAEAAIREALGAIEGARAIGGKLVVNVLPAGAPHKGAAVLRLRDQQGCDTALYVGDDQTDEDVFKLSEPGRLLGVRVGRSRTSRASYFIESQQRIDALLRALLAARRSASQVREEHHVLGL
jgi:trehalose 6-phosphate phosphatase